MTAFAPEADANLKNIFTKLFKTNHSQPLNAM